MADQIRKRVKLRARFYDGKWAIESPNVVARGCTIQSALRSYGILMEKIAHCKARNCDGTRCHEGRA